MGSGGSKVYNGESAGSCSGLKSSSSENENPKVFTLLGTGGVGKSTVLKQMIRTNGFSDEDKNVCRVELGKNVRILVDEWITFVTEHRVGKEMRPNVLRDLHPQVYERIEQFQRFKALDVDMLLKERKIFLEVSNDLWKHPSLQHLQEDFISTTSHKSAVAAEVLSTISFMSSDNFERISKEDYVPSDEDMVQLRTQTSELFEKRFEYEKKAFILRDIGGQVQHQHDWMASLQDACAIIFIVSLDDFHIFDADGRNQLMKSQRLFKTLCSSVLLDETPIVLLFNKEDLFETNIRKYPLEIFKNKSSALRDSESPSDRSRRCKGYITEFFLKTLAKERVNQGNQNKNTCNNFYFTNALDVELTQSVVQRVVSIRIQQILEQSGL